MGWHRKEEREVKKNERVRRSTTGESAAWLACPPHFASRLRTDSSCKAPNLRENSLYASTASSQSIGVHTAHRRPAHVLRVHDGTLAMECPRPRLLSCTARHGTADAARGKNFFCLQAVEGCGGSVLALWPQDRKQSPVSERSRGASQTMITCVLDLFSLLRALQVNFRLLRVLSIFLPIQLPSKLIFSLFTFDVVICITWCF